MDTTENTLDTSDRDLAAELAAVLAAAKAAELSPAEQERLKVLAQIEEAKEAARNARRGRRRIEGLAREKEARREANGKYSVRFFDLADHLQDVPEETLLGKGVVVLRSHTAAAKVAFDADTDNTNPNREKVPYATTLTDLTMASIVYPKLDDVTALRFRAFLESDAGSGLPVPMGAAVLELGGTRSAEAKRAKK